MLALITVTLSDVAHATFLAWLAYRLSPALPRSLSDTLPPIPPVALKIIDTVDGYTNITAQN